VQPDTNNIPLRDIHLPDSVSWWPPALGWWLLLVLVVLIVALFFWSKRRRQLFKLRNSSMAELDAIYKAYQKQYDAKRFARELSVLLRRVCISYFPTSDAAGLTGTAWLVFLDSLLSAKHNKSGQKFSNGVGEVLVKAPYQHNLKASDIDVEALYKLSTEWIYSLGPMHRIRTSNPKRQKLSDSQLSDPQLSNPKLRNEAAHVSV